MGIEFIYPEFEVIRNENRCIQCRVCERQCANEVHSYSSERGVMISDESKCVNCQRCVSLCPTRALKIVKSDCTLRENANWQNDTIKEVYKQANSGGVLLSSMGNPKPLPIYWDKILINASQVTNPPIDPLREPMETRVFLGKKPEKIERDASGAVRCRLDPQISLSMPVMFSAMSYGSISYNAHASLARAATELGILYNTGEGGLHEDFYRYGPNTIVQVASGRFGVHEDYLNAGAAIEIKTGQGAKPGIGGHLPGAKIVGDVSRTRMIPEGSDAISLLRITIFIRLRICVSWFTLSRKRPNIKNPSSSRWRLYTISPQSPAELPAAVPTSSPSTDSGAGPARRRPESGTMSEFRSNLPWPRWTSVCGTKESATTFPWSSAVPSARRRMWSRPLRWGQMPAISPPLPCWLSAVTCAEPARAENVTGGLRPRGRIWSND